MRNALILASALTLSPPSAQAASPMPNDCWFGGMTADNTSRGQPVASGPVAQWRVGMPLSLYPAKGDPAKTDAGEAVTFDTSRPITVTPTWISGPEPGDKDSGEEKSIQVMLKYRDANGATGIINLTYWSPMSGRGAVPPAQSASIDQIEQQLHDMVCRGVP